MDEQLYVWLTRREMTALINAAAGALLDDEPASTPAGAYVERELERRPLKRADRYDLNVAMRKIRDVLWAS